MFWTVSFLACLIRASRGPNEIRWCAYCNTTHKYSESISRIQRKPSIDSDLNVFQFQAEIEKRKGKEEMGILLSSLDVRFFVVLSVGAEEGYATCDAYVVQSNAIWVLDVDDHCVAGFQRDII